MDVSKLFRALVIGGATVAASCTTSEPAERDATAPVPDSAPADVGADAADGALADVGVDVSPDTPTDAGELQSCFCNTTPECCDGESVADGFECCWGTSC